MTAESAPPVCFPIERPRALERGPVALGFAGFAGLSFGMLYLTVFPGYLDADHWPPALYAVASGGALLGAMAGAWWVAGPATPLPIVVEETSALIPRLPYSRRPVRVALASIRSITLARPIVRPMMVFDVGFSFAFFVPIAALGGPDRAAALQAALTERMARLPQGDTRLRRQARADAVARAVWPTRPYVTISLMVAVTSVWLAQLWTGSLTNPDRLIRQGAVAWWLVKTGDWDRWITASFLHYQYWHFPMNAISFVALAPMVEGALGSWRLSIVLLLSGLGTMTFVTAFTPFVAVGMSGMICSMLAAIAVINVARQSEISPPLRLTGWIAALAVFGIVSGEQLLQWASAPLHAAGFVSGALATAVLLPSLDLARPSATPPRWIRTLSLCLLAVYVVGFGRGIVAAYSRGPLDSAKRALRLIDDPRFANAQVRSYGSAMVYRSEGDGADLRRAADGIASRDFGEDSDLADFTEAGLRFRLGELDRASSLMRRALRVDGLEEYALHLADMDHVRLLAAPTRTATARVGVQGQPRPAMTLSLAARPSPTTDTLAPARTTRPAPPASPTPTPIPTSAPSRTLNPIAASTASATEIIVLLDAPDAPVGIVRVLAGPSVTWPLVVGGLDPELLAVLPLSTPVVTSVEGLPASADEVGGDEVELRFWRFDPDLLVFPRPDQVAAD